MWIPHIILSGCITEKHCKRHLLFTPVKHPSKEMTCQWTHANVEPSFGGCLATNRRTRGVVHKLCGGPTISSGWYTTISGPVPIASPSAACYHLPHSWLVGCWIMQTDVVHLGQVGWLLTHQPDQPSSGRHRHLSLATTRYQKFLSRISAVIPSKTLKTWLTSKSTELLDHPFPTVMTECPLVVAACIPLFTSLPGTYI